MFELAAALLLAAGPAGESCAVPSGLIPAPVIAEGEARPRPIAKYVLAWYWWPENCAQFPGEGCSQGFGFKLHGLWPNAVDQPYPQFCRPPGQLDRRTVRENWCMTPSVTLLQHEWAKHGTCRWSTPKAYFKTERRLHAQYRMPDADKLPPAGLTAGAIRTAVIALNPGVPRDALFIGTDKKQRLTEVWMCLDLAYKPIPCDAGGTGAPDRVPVQVRGR